MQINGLIAHHARYRPGHEAVVFGPHRLTWEAFNRRVNQLSHALRDAGVGKGDRVATVLSNCLELLEVYWACAKLGAVAVPLSPLLTASGLASLLKDAAPTVVFASRETMGDLAAVKSQLASLRCCVLVDAFADGCRHYADFVAGRSELDVDAAVAADDVFNIMYTSGTTGMPKGIVHTHRIRATYGTLFANAWRMTPASVVLHTGAIVFNGAFVTLMPAFTLGARYVLAERFDAGQAIETIANEGVTHTMMVPSQIVAMLNAPNFDPARLQSLEMLLSLGAPLSMAHKDILEAAMPGRFYELYGLTEGFVTILDRDDAQRKRGTVGVPPPFFEMRIVREDDAPAAVGEIGEIVGRGPILMTGYYQRDDLTADAIRDGWLYTGDLGFVDADGYLSLVDRKKDMIDSGGVKVYPRDVEELIVRHPAGMEAVVFGIPDERWGESPAAAVTLKADEEVAADALMAWVNERVAARYQRLRALTIVDTFPRNAAGKILKRELREPYWAGREAKI